MLSPMCRTNLKKNLKYNSICITNQTVEIANNENGDKLILFNVLPGVLLAIKSCLRDRSSLCWVEIREKINSQNNLVLEFTSKGNDELRITKIDIANSTLADILPKRRVKRDTNLSRNSSEDATAICPSTNKNGEKTICLGGITSTKKGQRGCPEIKNMKTICLGGIDGEKRIKRNLSLKLSILKVSLRLSVLNSNKLNVQGVLRYMNSTLSIL